MSPSENKLKYHLDNDFYTPDFDNLYNPIPKWDGETTVVVTPVDGVYTVENVEQFAYVMQNVTSAMAAKGLTVDITSDIDLNGKTWTPKRLKATMDTGKSVTFDFHGNTIYGLSAPLFDEFGGTVKNLTISGATISTGSPTPLTEGYMGILACVMYGPINNVTVENCTIYCPENMTENVAGLVGLYANGNASDLLVKDLTINNAYNGKAGGMFGTMNADGSNSRSLTNCVVENVVINGIAAGNEKAGAILGRNVTIALTMNNCSAINCTPSKLVGLIASGSVTEN